MAIPKFTDSNGLNPYIWAEWPDFPSDRADVSTILHEQASSIEHTRNAVPYSHLIVGIRGIWVFGWRQIEKAMVDSLRAFYEMDDFRFFISSTGGLYYKVYIPKGAFEPELSRGGRYNLTLKMVELTHGQFSSSSSRSSSSSFSSSLSSSSLSSSSLSSSSSSSSISSSSFSSSSLSSLSSSLAP